MGVIVIIELDLSVENVIFDDTVYGAKPATEKSEVVPNIPEIAYERTKSETVKEVSLDDLTYYSRVRRSEQRTTRISPDWLNSDKTHIAKDLKGKNKVPESNEIAVASNDWVIWQKAMEEKMKTLDTMGTWNLINLPSVKKWLWKRNGILI